MALHQNPKGATTMATTLTGWLGRDREVRYTQKRTFEQEFHNELVEMDEVREVTISPREFLVLSLGVGKVGQKKSWHRLVIWSPEERGLDYVHLARKGDLVRITGRRETFRFTDKHGKKVVIRQIVVKTFKVLKLKVRHEVP
jgi:single-stranded DNA-binding protein